MILSYIYYYGYGRISINKMLLKAAVIITLGGLDPGNDISMAGILELDF